MNSGSEPLNGIDPHHAEALRELLFDARRVEAFSGPWTARSTWSKGFESTSTVRGHTISFDEPADLAGRDSAPTPHEYLLSALGGCLIAGAIMHATVQAIRIDRLEITLSGTFDNILRWAGIDENGYAGYRSMEVHVVIAGDADDVTLRALWDRTLAGSPVASTISRPTPLVSSVDVVGTRAE
ncbi:OsmC family protein [Rhodococcoides kyotonense]|uniref:Uncharacterized OsmC-related protein n=1 Tax=Rhodococcoides kyotonense TaxID=398843 RepID=A0A239JW50_9NOCA|nr:OsmC family protein [Rhodococcus kyotonensis]SNT09990.1 Uncharacterized OsmC-related protein [Rhodococcus kyotonensis]